MDAATYADIWHTWAYPSDFLRKCDVLDRHCLRVGRDPAAIERATGQVVRVTAAPAPGSADDDVVGTTEQITEALIGYANSRATESIVRDGLAVPAGEALDMMSALTTEVLPHLAARQPSRRRVEAGRRAPAGGRRLSCRSRTRRCGRRCCRSARR